MSEHFAVRHPVRLYAEPVDALNARNEWALHAVDQRGNRVTIIATGERFRDALQPRWTALTPAEQVRAMYVRGEVEVEAFERALDDEARSA